MARKILSILFVCMMNAPENPVSPAAAQVQAIIASKSADDINREWRSVLEISVPQPIKENIIRQAEIFQTQENPHDSFVKAVETTGTNLSNLKALVTKANLLSLHYISVSLLPALINQTSTSQALCTLTNLIAEIEINSRADLGERREETIKKAIKSYTSIEGGLEVINKAQIGDITQEDIIALSTKMATTTHLDAILTNAERLGLTQAIPGILDNAIEKFRDANLYRIVTQKAKEYNQPEKIYKAMEKAALNQNNANDYNTIATLAHEMVLSPHSGEHRDNYKEIRYNALKRAIGTAKILGELKTVIQKSEETLSDDSRKTELIEEAFNASVNISSNAQYLFGLIDMASERLQSSKDFYTGIIGRSLQKAYEAVKAISAAVAKHKILQVKAQKANQFLQVFDKTLKMEEVTGMNYLTLKRDILTEAKENAQDIHVCIKIARGAATCLVADRDTFKTIIEDVTRKAMGLRHGSTESMKADYDLIKRTKDELLK